jgi:hypothetical protein
MTESIEDINKQIEYLKQAIKEEKLMQKNFVLIPRQIANSKKKIKTYKNDIKNYTMKLKKGSKAAKDFMAKIRNLKSKPKKSKVGAVKNNTHNDTKSHNYKISISGDKQKKLSADAVSSMRSIAKAIQIIYKRNAWGDSELNNRENIAKAYTMLWELILSNGYTITQAGKLTKTIL